MTLCSNRPEGFGPRSHLYSHVLTSCFLDTILVPLCTWLYLLALILLLAAQRRRSASVHGPSSSIFGARGFSPSKTTADVEVVGLDETDVKRQHGKIHTAFSVLYYLLLLAQILMCVLEITRLSLAHLGIGLLPFTFVTLLTAAALRFTRGIKGRIGGWRWANLAVWIALAVANGVKVAEEVKEGTGQRKGSKYPVADEVTDVSVMIGVYAALGILEASLRA
ncbi:hypothetical protein MMC28_005284 [Mycoblastus sanguinarius]|nr:hypothetical protein [Mycoblastus sanguinarius]